MTCVHRQQAQRTVGLLCAAVLVELARGSSVTCVADAPLKALTRVRVALNTSTPGPQRSFLLTLPTLPVTSAQPLVLAVHGAYDNATYFLDYASPAVDVTLASRGFVAAAPEALVDGILNGTIWDGTFTAADAGYVSAPVTAANRDLAFLWDVVTCLRGMLNVSLANVFAMGHSQGAKLSTSLACSPVPPGLAGVTVRGVAASEGIKVDVTHAQMCLNGSTPPLMAFQAQTDSVVPFCSAGVYAPGAAYWGAWATHFSGCSRWPHLPARQPQQEMNDTTTYLMTQALCPPAGLVADNTSTTALLRAYSGLSCASPIALFWTRERSSAAAHAWPSRMAALGGADGAEVAAAFFESIMVTGVSTQSFSSLFGIPASFTTCPGSLGAFTSEPCAAGGGTGTPLLPGSLGTF